MSHLRLVPHARLPLPFPAALRGALVVLPLCAACGSGDGGSSAGNAAVEPTAEAPAFIADEGTVTLEAGQEGLLCNQMAVPAEYATGDYFVTGIDADVSMGTHHLVVMGGDEALGATPRLCNDTAKQPTTGGASFQDLAYDANLAKPVIDSLKRVAFAGGGGAAKIRFPAGYGKPMPLGFFETSHHVLNVGSDPLEIHGRFGVHVAREADVEFPLAAFFANSLNVDIAPMSDGTVEGTMTAPEAMDVVVLTAHSHELTTRFEMFLYRNGIAEETPIYTSTSYESPPVTVLDPPLRLEAGDGIMFRCTYRNDTQSRIQWGVDGGEMCMPQGMYARPDGKARGVPTTLSVLLHDPAPQVLVPGTSGFFG